ncbi:hypothetical protein AB4423_25440 [Vibrio chagasii]|uniref:hypothetical protein n=3 Tax=Vibrio TaxID=662 RepID=UPI00354B99BA
MNLFLVLIFFCFNVKSCELYLYNLERTNLINVYGEDIYVGQDKLTGFFSDDLIISLKYRYGIGLNKDLEKSSDILLSYTDSKIGSGKDDLGMKYYLLGTYNYSCKDRFEGLEYLKKSAEYGFLKSNFLYGYISYYGLNDEITTEQYFSSLSKGMSNADGYSIFQYIYLSFSTGEISGVKQWIDILGGMNLFETCDLYNFHKFGIGVRGIVSDWETKNLIIRKLWPEYELMCK